MPEVAQFAALLLSLLSLLAVAHAAFFSVATPGSQSSLPALGMLLLAGVVCLASGAVFATAPHGAARRRSSVITSLPMLVYWWAAALMVSLYALSGYLESHFILRSFFHWSA